MTEDDRRGNAPSTEDVDLDRPRRANEMPALVRLSRTDRVPARLTVVLLVFVGLAIVKPWPSGPGERPRPNLVARTPTASASADPLTLVRGDCQEPPGWRTYSREAWDRGQLRSWRSLEPATAASSPLDPSIPAIPFVASVLELGFCAPWTGPERPPAGATVSAWRIVAEASRDEPRHAASVPLRPASATLTLPYGAMYRPPAFAAGDRWPSGTWVFEVAAPGWERWWAAEIGLGDEPVAGAPSGPGASGATPPQPVP